MISVAISTDENYLPYVEPLLKSIERHTREDVAYHIMTRNIGHDMQIKGYNVHQHIMDDVAMDTDLLRHTTASTMDRLFLPSLLSREDRVIYLDVDALVLSDLSVLYAKDTGSKGILARQSEDRGYAKIKNIVKSCHPAYKDQIFREVDPEWDSFNAGVMLLDLDRLRSNNFEKTALDWVKRFRVHDQTACAMYSANEFARLEHSWNVWVDRDHERDVDWNILHWVGTRKPWHEETTLRDLWLENYSD